MRNQTLYGMPVGPAPKAPADSPPAAKRKAGVAANWLFACGLLLCMPFILHVGTNVLGWIPITFAMPLPIITYCFFAGFGLMVLGASLLDVGRNYRYPESYSSISLERRNNITNIHI